MTFGELIRSKRWHKRWSIRKLEALSGVSNAVISQIENGHVKDPGFTTAVKLASALGISPDAAFKTAFGPLQPRDVLRVNTKRVVP
jgi:transcriptional regulator with XRE-family HTH domain